MDDNKIIHNWKVLRVSGNKADVECMLCNTVYTNRDTFYIMSGKSKCCRKCANMQTTTNRIVGKVYNNWCIDEYEGMRKVTATCLLCNTQYKGENLTYITRGTKTSCSACAEKARLASRDKTGFTIGHWHVDDGKRMDTIDVTCLDCGESFKGVARYTVVGREKSNCPVCLKKKREGKYTSSDTYIKSGTMFGYWRVLEDLGSGKLHAECTKCNSVFRDKNKYSIMRGDSKMCASCSHEALVGVSKKQRLLKTGEIFNSWKVIEDLGNQTLKLQCLECGKEYVRKGKADIVRGRAECCRSCSSRKRDAKWRLNVGDVYGDLRIISDEGSKAVTVECIKCGKVSRGMDRRDIRALKIGGCRVCVPENQRKRGRKPSNTSK